MKEKSTLANIFYNSFGTMFYYGCQWLTTILIVRLSGYQDAGNYSLAMTFTAAFAIFALFNTRQYQVSDVKGEYSDRTYILSRYIAMGAAFLLCAIGLLFNAYTPYQWGVILLYMVFKCGEAWVDVYHGICQKKGRMDFICYSFLMRGMLMIVSFCGLIYITGNLMYGVLAMTVTTFLVIYFYDRHMALKFVEEGDKADLNGLKTLVVILIPLVIVAVTNNLSISLPKYFLERYFDETVLGYYSSVATPSMIVQVGASTIFIPLITPLADKLLSDDKKGFAGILKKVFLAFVVLSVLAVIVSFLLGEWFLVQVFGEEIRPYAYLFVPIITTTLLISINACLFPVCTVFREIKGQLFVGIFGIISSLAASMVLVKRYCMDGVVIALLITLGIQIIIEIYLVFRRMKRWKEI
ncbi:MAG: oligosaccharide flippase family protein [Lachnospiraceae bacterium]|nr:oligosaccharide flippase family protein [Lachnospiraceae bacterium]MDE6981591.1 oligosaccharide flippase family protein [Lachnospiraceae bacterium]